MVPRALLFLTLLAGSSAVSWAAEEDVEKLYPQVYYVPAGAFSRPDPSAKDGTRKPNDWAVPIEAGGSKRALDVREYFAAQGLLMSPESEAIFFEESGVLFVRLTRKNIKLLESINDCDGGISMDLPQAEISVVSMQVPASRPEGGLPSYFELKKMAGSSWTEIARSTVLAKPGRKAVASTLSGGKVPEIRPETNGIARIELPPDAHGSACLIETVISPDRKYMDATLSFRFRSGTDSAARNMAFDGSTTLLEGFPQVLQLTGPMDDGLTYALILRVSLTQPNSWPVRTPIKEPTDP